ncbi:MAG: spore cortex-lytic protein [Lawsonibacter sp.]
MANVGKLSVKVYTSQAEIPLEGATVVVTRNSKTGKYDLLSVQLTDSSGRIRCVEVPTLNDYKRVQSGGEEAVALCSVWAEHPGYTMLRVDGVRVCSGEETVQSLELIPLAEGQSSLQRRDVRQIIAQSRSKK